MPRTTNSLKSKWNDLSTQEWFPRVFPFAVFMAFVMLESAFTSHVYLIYIAKSITVGLILLYFRNRYSEISWNISLKDISLAVIFGITVFILWINMTWDFAVIGSPRTNNPYTMLGKGILYPAIFFRILGASVVVPVMEEIFWRSFVIRWIDDKNFLSMPVGTFSLQSFFITVLLFGSEHNLWLAGIVAGILYNLLLYYKKSISLCIIAHGVTNFILGIYVLYTDKWMFW
ncbi:MAG: CAAX prenyl protease-related protein [Nitrospirae bacterium]|nr:CAAX prenyl protease-related protein [Nitrospirota bacterium]